MGGTCGAPRLLGIYLISKMHTKTIQKIQKAYIKTYEEDVKIYKDIENSQGQEAFFLKTPVALRLNLSSPTECGSPAECHSPAECGPGSFLYLYIFLHLLHMFLYMLFVFFV